MKRKVVLAETPKGLSVAARLEALKRFREGMGDVASEQSQIEPELGLSPTPLSQGLAISLPEAEKFSMVGMVCRWPGVVVRTGEVTGVRYVFEKGREVPVDVRDKPGLLRIERTTGGCCGHKKRAMKLFMLA